MNRSINYRKKQVEYLMSTREFLEKLGIPESMKTVYFSTSNRTMKVICKMEDK